MVDYFEVTPGPRAQARIDELLTWWNRYILLTYFPLKHSLTIVTDKCLDVLLGARRPSVVAALLCQHWLPSVVLANWRWRIDTILLLLPRNYYIFCHHH
jgi:hypothetical protein